MHEAVTRMLAKYEPRSVDDSVRALREIIQEVALLGLWRAKFSSTPRSTAVRPCVSCTDLTGSPRIWISRC